MQTWEGRKEEDRRDWTATAYDAALEKLIAGCPLHMRCCHVHGTAGAGFAACTALIALQPGLPRGGRAAAVAEDVQRWLRLVGPCLAVHTW